MGFCCTGLRSRVGRAEVGAIGRLGQLAHIRALSVDNCAVADLDENPLERIRFHGDSRGQALERSRALGSARGAYDKFWNTNCPVLRGVPRVGFNDEVLALRIGIGQELEDFSI
jgi:hypothetical protein